MWQAIRAVAPVRGLRSSTGTPASRSRRAALRSRWRMAEISGVLPYASKTPEVGAPAATRRRMSSALLPATAVAYKGPRALMSFLRCVRDDDGKGKESCLSADVLVARLESVVVGVRRMCLLCRRKTLGVKPQLNTGSDK